MGRGNLSTGVKSHFWLNSFKNSTVTTSPVTSALGHLQEIQFSSQEFSSHGIVYKIPNMGIDESGFPWVMSMVSSQWTLLSHRSRAL